MNNLVTIKYGWIRKAHRAAIKTQEHALIEAGYDPTYFFYASENEIEDLVGTDDQAGALRRGNWLGVWRYDLIAPPREKSRDRAPRKVLRQATDQLLKLGIVVEELATGRTCKDENGVYEIYADAIDRLAGYTGHKGARGRPKKIHSPENIEAARAIWKSLDYATNAEAVAAMPGNWKMSEAHKTFGPSGRGKLRERNTR